MTWSRRRRRCCPLGHAECTTHDPLGAMGGHITGAHGLRITWYGLPVPGQTTGHALGTTSGFQDR
jgi:hypothetical protein